MVKKAEILRALERVDVVSEVAHQAAADIAVTTIASNAPKEAAAFPAAPASDHETTKLPDLIDRNGLTALDLKGRKILDLKGRRTLDLKGLNPSDPKLLVLNPVQIIRLIDQTVLIAAALVLRVRAIAKDRPVGQKLEQTHDQKLDLKAVLGMLMMLVKDRHENVL